MSTTDWKNPPLIERIRWLRYVLPPILAVVVVAYQLGVAQRLAERYGHPLHYAVEIAFYSLVGPIVTWVTLIWIEHSLAEKEQLERQVQARTQQLASLTAVSADAILSLDTNGRISSWNRGAERMLNYKAEEIVGQPLTALLPEAEQLANRLHQQGEVQNFETMARMADGRLIPVDLSQTRQTTGPKDSLASLIIMRDITVRREREAILEEERARIARDLHDGVAQTLYFLALKADMARQQVAENPDQVRADLKEIGQKIRQVIRDVRRTIFALRPLDWARQGFLPALKQFVHDFAEQVGWQANMEIAPDVVVPPRLEATVFRLVQESLNNVAKHAEATQIWVQICTESEENGRFLQIIIRDNGRGFDPTQTKAGGLGLEQMDARVKAVNGRWHITSRPHQNGTTITFHLPLTGETNE